MRERLLLERGALERLHRLVTRGCVTTGGRLTTWGRLTTRGWCLLTSGAAAALGAVLINERDLLRVAAFALLLPLLAGVVLAGTRIRLHADRELRPARTSVGDECQAQLTLRVTGRCGGRVLLEDVVPEALGGPRRAVLTGAAQHREFKLVYPLIPAERSVHSLGPLTARLTDPLGLAECRRTLVGTSLLVVIPAVVPLTGLPAGAGAGTGAAGGVPVSWGSGGDSPMVRSYRQGDDLRRVHWRSSARRDELMVRIEEWSQHSGITVLLDHRAVAHRGSGAASSLEYAVSLAASLYMHLRQHAPPVRLVTVDGVVRAEPGQAAEGALDALAALSPTDQCELAGVPETAGRQEVIAILGAAGAAAVNQLLANRQPGTAHRAVLLDVATWATEGDGKIAPPPAKAGRLLRTAGWSVVVAGASSPLASVWDQLCAGSHRTLGVPR